MVIDDRRAEAQTTFGLAGREAGSFKSAGMKVELADGSRFGLRWAPAIKQSADDDTINDIAQNRCQRRPRREVGAHRPEDVRGGKKRGQDLLIKTTWSSRILAQMRVHRA
jgi:hypothetical protein